MTAYQIALILAIQRAEQAGFHHLAAALADLLRREIISSGKLKLSFTMENEPSTETDTAPEFSGRATYEPESNCLRLYVGRVPRDEYLKLRAEGWRALHKQREAGGGDFVATWTPDRRDTAIEYAGVIEDEDMSVAERAADRAERFGGYRDKRAEEAGARADAFDAGPQAHGFQSQARAERSARRHDRVAGRACDAWSKAEYWQSRTAGVIAHRLHLSSPGVRMGRIKELESEIRKSEKNRAEYVEMWQHWQECAAMTDAAEQAKRAEYLAGSLHSYDYKHPRPEEVTNSHVREKGSGLCTLLDLERNEYGKSITGAEACAMFFARHRAPSGEGDWLTHYRLRLAYENQMLEAQGGRAAFVEMQVGGWIGSHQIRKVNRSNETGRVVSVTLKQRGTRYDSRAPGWCLIPYNIERMPADAYRTSRKSRSRLRCGMIRGLTSSRHSRRTSRSWMPQSTRATTIAPTNKARSSTRRGSSG